MTAPLETTTKLNVARTNGTETGHTGSMTNVSHPKSSRRFITTGRWSDEEHEKFLCALEKHGRNWRKIAEDMETRNFVQIRTHAQKYFKKLAKLCEVKGEMVPMELTSTASDGREWNIRKRLNLDDKESQFSYSLSAPEPVAKRTCVDKRSRRTSSPVEQSPSSVTAKVSGLCKDEQVVAGKPPESRAVSPDPAFPQAPQRPMQLAPVLSPVSSARASSPHPKVSISPPTLPTNPSMLPTNLSPYPTNASTHPTDPSLPRTVHHPMQLPLSGPPPAAMRRTNPLAFNMNAASQGALGSCNQSFTTTPLISPSSVQVVYYPMVAPSVFAPHPHHMLQLPPSTRRGGVPPMPNQYSGVGVPSRFHMPSIRLPSQLYLPA